MNYDNLKLKNQLCHPLYSASNALVRAYEPLLKELDLTYPQYLVMLALWERDSVPMGHLCEETLFDSGSLTPIVKRLSVKGYVKVQNSQEDLRQKLVVLTKKGQKLKDQAIKVPELMACQMNLTLSEALELKRLILKLKSNLLPSRE